MLWHLSRTIKLHLTQYLEYYVASLCFFSKNAISLIYVSVIILYIVVLILVTQVKCHRYWPNSGANVYGNYKVTLHKEEQLTNYCLRQFIIEQVLYIIRYQQLLYLIYMTIVGL